MATTAPAPAPQNNSIFVVGFSNSATKEDLQAFFEKSLPSAKITSIALRSGRRIRRRENQDQDAAQGTPFAFVTFEADSSVQAALALINGPKRDALGEFGANLKAEQVGKKDRTSNSLYVTGFNYSETIQADLAKFLSSNLAGKASLEIDVRRAIVKNKETKEDQEKSFAFVFCPNEDIKKAVLQLKGGKIGGAVIDIQERAERVKKPQQRRAPRKPQQEDGTRAPQKRRAPQQRRPQQGKTQQGKPQQQQQQRTRRPIAAAAAAARKNNNSKKAETE